MFKKLFSTILLLAASSHSAAATADDVAPFGKAAKGTRKLEPKADKPLEAKAEKTSGACSGNEVTELIIKLNLARVAAIQLVGLFDLGDEDATIDGAEYQALKLIANTNYPVPPLYLPFDTDEDNSVTIDEITAALLGAWQDFCADEMKEMLDGVILSRIAGYNVGYVLTGADED